MGKIYVGNLSSNLSETDLLNLFARWGKVHSIELVTNPRTGQCRGYGFVEMEDNDARAAADALDGSIFSGQTLRVTSLTGC